MARLPRTGRAAAFAALAALCVAAGAAAAGAGELDALVWPGMTVRLFGGLALFLFGMELMADALKAAAGERMKAVLSTLTMNRFMGAATGAFVTAVIQSSSVTTVLAVGFVTAGLMSTVQAIGVIMGANIGTTVTAQIVAFKVTKLSYAMMGAGFAMRLLADLERVRQYGTMIMGLGLIFFGMTVMSEAMAPLRTYQPFLDLMVRMENPLVGIVFAAAFTGLIQSSSATTGIVIALASQGLITLPAGIALAFGANIGTCVTALLAAVGKPREAVRAAAVHVLFNVAGVLLWLGFIGELAAFVSLISPSYPELTGTERLAAETPRQIANAHTIFNVANTLVFIWTTSLIARLVDWLIPDPPLETGPHAVAAAYLDVELIETPSLALDRVRLEVLQIGRRVQEMLDEVVPAINARDARMLAEVERMDDDVDVLYRQTIEYLAMISKGALTTEQNDHFIRLMDAVNNLESIGDVIETDLVSLGYKLSREDVRISRATQRVLVEIQQATLRAVDAAVQAVSTGDETQARRVTEMKAEINALVDSATLHESRRLVAEEPHRVSAYTIEMDIIEKLKRIYYFAKRMAKTVSPQPGAPLEVESES